MRNGEKINRTDKVENNQHKSGAVFSGERFYKPKEILPDKEKIIILQGDNERKNELLEKIRYLNGDNFRLQIGKMQEDAETLYSPDVLRCFISYILKHIERDGNKGKIIIQLRPSLAQKLLQKETGKILSYDDEKVILQNFVDNFYEGGKYIEIQNVAENYPKIFNALDKGKKGIIPDEEPINPLESPFEIVSFLAYNAVHDKNLMDLFYETKPEKYREQDISNGLNAGDSDADFYSVVEVGIRLYEILNGVHIQGGINRQKVYDRIIGLILFGEDKISKKGKKLNIKDFPALEKLHKLIQKGGYKDIRMQQLYLDLDNLNTAVKKCEEENKIIETRQKQERKKEKMGKVRSYLKSSAIGLGILMTLFSPEYCIKKHEKSQKTLKDFTERQMNKENLNIPDELLINFRGSLDLNNLKESSSKKVEDLFIAYISSNKNILEALSKGEISTESIITDFWKIYGGILINEYRISFKPYDLIRDYDTAIENTIKKEIIEPKKFSAITDGKIYAVTGHLHGGDRIYCIKKVIIDDGGTKKELLFASSSGFGGPYTLYDGFRVASGINYFTSVKHRVPEIFDNTILNNTKQRITHGNFSLDIDVGKQKEYSMKSGGNVDCYIYSLYDTTTLPNVCVSQCDEDDLIIYDDFVTRKLSTGGFRGKSYNLVRVNIGGKEYLLAGEMGAGGGSISIEMLGNIDKNYLTDEELVALENSLHSGFSIRGFYSSEKRFLNLQIFKPNYSFYFRCSTKNKISINGEDFYTQILDCGLEEGELLFASKGSNRGSFTLENGKIVAEYLKKYKDTGRQTLPVDD